MCKKRRTLSRIMTLLLLVCLCVPPVFAQGSNGTIDDTDDLMGSEMEGVGKIWFLIDATAGEGGLISPSGKNLTVRNKPKTYEIIPAEGYQIADVKVDGVSVGAVKQYTFKTIQDHHTIAATFVKSAADAGVTLPIQYGAYQDLNAAGWYANYVGFVLQRGLMDGTSQTAFSPNAPVTRGVMILALYRMSGEGGGATAAGFQDVAENSPYYAAVNWGVAKGIVSGYSAASFGPNDPVTREQMAIMFWKYAGSPVLSLPNPSVVLEKFSDRAQISDWALDAMRWAVNETLFAGDENGNLVPQDTATRAQAAVLLEKMAGLTE